MLAAFCFIWLLKGILSPLFILLPSITCPLFLMSEDEMLCMRKARRGGKAARMRSPNFNALFPLNTRGVKYEGQVEFGSERIPRCLLRGKRANTEWHLSLRIEDSPRLAVESFNYVCRSIVPDVTYLQLLTMRYSSVSTISEEFRITMLLSTKNLTKFFLLVVYCDITNPNHQYHIRKNILDFLSIYR